MSSGRHYTRTSGAWLSRPGSPAVRSWRRTAASVLRRPLSRCIAAKRFEQVSIAPFT